MGQVVLQKGLLAKTNQIRKAIKIPSDKKNIPPCPVEKTGKPVSGLTGFHSAQGIPAVRVPAGQIIEKVVSPVI